MIGVHDRRRNGKRHSILLSVEVAQLHHFRIVVGIGTPTRIVFCERSDVISGTELDVLPELIDTLKGQNRCIALSNAGERALNRVCPFGFEHAEQSVRTVDILEKDGKGLNLTYEVRDGIRNHQTIGKPHTLEGKIVRLSDKIAYIHHDMDDAIRGGILTEADVPKDICEVIGSSPTERLDHFIHDIVTNSMDKGDILMSEPVAEAMTKIRQFMFERVYKNPIAKSEEGKAEMLMETLYQHFLKHLDDLPEEYLNLLSVGEPREKVVCDYVGAMTDRFAIAVYEDIYIPKSWQR